MTYPLQFRTHVIATRKRYKLTLAETALRFNIGVASLIRWLKSPAPKAYPYRIYKLDLDALLKDVIENPYIAKSI